MNSIGYQEFLAFYSEGVNSLVGKKKESSSHMDPTVVNLSLWVLEWLFHLLSSGPLAAACGISLGNLKPGISGHCSWCAVEEGERLLQQVVQEAVKPVSIWKRRKGEEISFGRNQILEEKANEMDPGTGRKFAPCSLSLSFLHSCSHLTLLSSCQDHKIHIMSHSLLWRWSTRSVTEGINPEGQR